MADSFKDIIITPNRGSSTADPKIEFRGGNSTTDTTITIQTYPTSNGTLSFEGSSGQLFSITNDMNGTIFAVNDVSGIPSIEVLDTGLIKLGEFNGSVAINTSTALSGYSLTVGGNANISGNLVVGGTINATIQGSSTTATNLTGGAAGRIPIQSAAGITSFIPTGTSGQLLQYGTNTATWVSTSSLTVAGAATAQVANTVLAGQRTTNATHYLTFVDSNDASPTADAVYTTSSFVINPGTGNVGIGTTSPTGKLHVIGDTLIFQGSGGSNLSVINGSGIRASSELYLDTVVSTGGDIFIRPRTSTAVTIKTVTGNVGIGTTSPESKLHVSGDARITGITTVTNTTQATSTTTGALQVAGGAGIQGNLHVGGEIFANKLTIQLTTITTTLVETDDIIKTTNVTQATATATGALQIAGGASVGGNLWVGGNIIGNIATTVSTSTNSSNIATAARTNNANHFLAFVDSNNASATFEALYTTSSFVINPSTGRVGLGAATPSKTLDVRGDAIFTATVAPTSDIVTISNLGFPTTTAGTNALQVTYVGGTGAIEAAAVRADMTPGGTSASTWSAFRVAATAAAGTGVTFNGVKFDSKTAGAGTSNALWVGTGYDNILNYNGTTVINGSGQVVAAQILGSVSSSTTANTLATARTISLTGDVTGSLSFDGSTNVSMTATIAANSVALGTDTTGNYVADITQGSYILKTGTAGEGWSPTIAVDGTSTNTASKVVVRDGSGNFSAGTITANLTGTASAATNIAGGAAGRIPIQSGASTTSFVPTGSNGQVLTWSGTTATWASPPGGSTVETTARATSAVHYVTFVDSNNASATAETVYTTSSFSINPSNGNINIAGNLTVSGTVLSTVQTATNALNFDGVSSLTRSASHRANTNITGGGVITVDASSNVLWATRFIVIANGRGSYFSTAGYFDIACPTSGTITGVGGAANKTATAAGIPLGIWEALYYILPIGSGSGSIAANFRVSSYTADVDIPHNWVLICVRNGDTGRVYFNNGYSLKPGQSVNVDTYDAERSETADTLTTSRTIALSGAATGTATGFNGSANITIPVTGLNASNLDSGTVPDARLSGVYTGIGVKTSGNYTVFTDASSGSQNTSGRSVLNLVDYRNNTSAATGAIVFFAPNTTSTIMHRLRIEGMVYDSGPTILTIVQGYRTTGAWSNTSKINLGITDPEVRFATDPQGRNCVIVGNTTTSWSYPHVSITHAMFSHSGIVDSYCYGWTSTLVTSFNGYANITASLPDTAVASDVSGNAATATKLATARSIALSGDVTGSANFDGSANISITAAVVDDSHNHTVVEPKASQAAESTSSRTAIDSGIYTFNTTNASLGNSTPVAYWSTIAWGNGAAGSAELAADWTSNGNNLWYRSLRDSVDNWWPWKRIFTDEYHPNADTLTTARNINGVSFNGSANINISNLIGSNGTTTLETTGVTSAVNRLSVTNSVTGSPVLISTVGSDANIGLTLNTKGTGSIIIDTGTSTGNVEIKPGASNLLLWDDDSSHYYKFVTGNRTANYDVTLPDASGTFLLSHATENTAGYFYTGTTAPTGTTRLNYSGYFYPTFINLGSSSDTATAASHYMVETGSDGFVRPKTLANVKTEIMGNQYVVFSGPTAARTFTLPDASGTIALTSSNITGTSGGLAGGAAGRIPIQSGAGTTSFVPTGSNGQVLTWSGTTATWATPAGGSTVETTARTTNAVHYVTFVDSNNASATAETVYTTSSFALNPSTGAVSAGGDLYTNSALLTGNNTNGWGRLVNVSSGLYIQAGSLNSGSAVAQPIIFTNMYGGTERMRISADGNLSVGTSGGDYGRTWRFVARRDQNASSDFGFINGTAGASSAVTLSRIGGSANNYCDWRLSDGNGTSYDNFEYGSAVSYARWLFSGTERVRMFSGGGLSVGTTSNPGAGAIYATGNITAYFSDQRLKTVVGTIDNALDKISKIKGVYYTNNDVAKKYGYTSEELQVGVLAQDVENVLPEIVKVAPFDLDENNQSKSGENYKTLQYDKLVPLLVEAIKEQQKTIDDQNAKINMLEEKLNTIISLLGK